MHKRIARSTCAARIPRPLPRSRLPHTHAGLLHAHQTHTRGIIKHSHPARTQAVPCNSGCVCVSVCAAARPCFARASGSAPQAITMRAQASLVKAGRLERGAPSPSGGRRGGALPCAALPSATLARRGPALLGGIVRPQAGEKAHVLDEALLRSQALDRHLPSPSVG